MKQALWAYLRELVLVKCVKQSSSTAFSSISCHLVPGPFWPTGWIKEGHGYWSIRHSEMNPLLGLEKLLAFLKGARSPEASTGGSWEALGLAGCTGTTHSSWGEGSLCGAGHCSFGSLPYWAVLLAIWLSAPWTLNFI